MSTAADIEALAWGALEPDAALLDGRHSCACCAECLETITDKPTDTGDRSPLGLAPVDYCPDCRAEVFP